MSVTNLNKVRKERARADRKTRAAENSVRFGRTKAQKDVEKAQKAQNTSKFDSHKRDR